MSIAEPGKYMARCIDNPREIRWGRAKSGAEQIALTFALVDQSGAPTSSTMEWVGGFGTDQSANITIKSLRACGWSGDDLFELDGIGANVVELDVAWEDYQGERRLRIKWINTPGSGRLMFRDALDERSKRALGARLKGLLAKHAPQGSASAARKPDEDFPF